MEFLTILLSGVIGLVSPLGLAVDQVAEGAIRSQFQSVEQLQVRVDNAPTYQLLGGRADKIRVAGRGLYPIKDLRIAALELETDPVAVKLGGTNPGKLPLERPLNAGVRLVLTQADINRALNAAAVNGQFRNLTINLPNFPQGQDLQRYDFVNPRVTFLSGDRLRFQVELKEQKTQEQLVILAEAGLQILSGRQLQLLDPVVAVNGETVPDEILLPIVRGISQRSDLRSVEASGIMARVIRLTMTPDQQLEIAAIVHANPVPTTP